jgi:hypothetical protein
MQYGSLRVRLLGLLRGMHHGRVFSWQLANTLSMANVDDSTVCFIAITWYMRITSEYLFTELKLSGRICGLFLVGL